MHLLNETPFEAFALPLISHDDVQHVVVAAKGTFALVDGGRPLALAEEPLPLHMEDVYWADPQTSSLKYEADTAIRKLGTDVALIGSARSVTGPVAQLDVGIRIGPLQKIVRVFGDRYWRKSGDRFGLTPPRPFETMPLSFEHAYGGKDPTGQTPACYEPNPVGKGFVGEHGAGDLQALPAPNLERPDQLIRRIEDRPEPAGFGFIARHWQPRRGLLGSYDEAWMVDRNPLLPADFDERAYSAASPGLRSSAYLSGGEPVVIVNAAPAGRLEFRLPAHRLRAFTYIDGQRTAYDMNLDTVVVEPDADRLSLTWRAAVAVHWNTAMIEWVKVAEQT